MSTNNNNNPNDNDSIKKDNVFPKGSELSAKKKTTTTPIIVPTTNNKTTEPSTDPDKLGDALLSAGVNLHEEEALLNAQYSKQGTSNNKGNNGSNVDTPGGKKSTSRKVTHLPPVQPFLHPFHVNRAMRKVMKENKFGLSKIKREPMDLEKEKPEILLQMSTACELYMKDLIVNALVLSRHRRKSSFKNVHSLSNSSNSGIITERSEVSKALRKIALEEKRLEEKRLKKRQDHGLEKKESTKIRALNEEESMAKASNATANLMMGTKKKYSWLTSSSSSSSSLSKSSSGMHTIVGGREPAGPVANAINVRGEMGIKYKEAREESGIVMRDFLRALENRRVGTDINSIISKGYARIRD
ncbi:uncharacterized protein SCODWIG_03626 [Saccharomycodes ludwigii]|uniref:Transcription initiation factor TFIID subunit 4 n=1 Tax=Saccharomycodes ludwigii TaxID=36035 RepID=A0A376BB09_9ASCO|nr:hypothetical protein SCDLUD_000923 [Saccharomycodes ludwigii]KAH3903298.1 hypothetical protein SCDLUD_000923 [Saccharomycodes ludwigii]SSD61865.1 uncharacterized protein SCODWIG_03626 [Saccharomycodes ludwigii]